MPVSNPGAVANRTHVVPASAIRMTGEQENVVSAIHQGGTVKVMALAGTGKTSTLVETARTFPGRPSLYLAFNKSVQMEAARKFPGWVDVRTAHSLAYQAVGKQYGHRLPGGSGAGRRMSAKAIAATLKVKAASLDSGTLNPVLIVRVAQVTVANFMKSADREITQAHIPSKAYAHHAPNEVAAVVVPVARAIWADLTSVNGRFFYTPDVYLKQWQLTNPILHESLIMFDEAQDADPVIASIIARQTGQRVYVGDQNQAIYGWRGAVDAMSKVDGLALPLTKSFRFGPAIAQAANEWLGLLGSDLRVVGHDPIASTVGELQVAPRAILCRTNGTALGWVLAFHQRDMPVAMAPGDKSAGKDIERFAWAARDLMNGEGTDHPDLVGFSTWKELVDFVEEEEDTADLKRMVGIVNRIGVNGVIDAIRGLVPEEKAMVTVSTAHKAKGLEWSVVKVADDFTPPVEDEPGHGEPVERDPADLMLNYVTVTRAKQHLDPGPLGEPGLWTL